MIEIKRDKNYNIEIKDIKFTDEFITKSSKKYLKYLNTIMNDNNIGIKFHKEIDKIELKNMESNYDILSIKKMKNKELLIILSQIPNNQHTYYTKNTICILKK